MSFGLICMFWEVATFIKQAGFESIVAVLTIAVTFTIDAVWVLITVPWSYRWYSKYCAGQKGIPADICASYSEQTKALNFWEGPNKFRPGLFFRECLNDIQPFACKNKIAFGWQEPRNCVSRSLGFIRLQFPALISHRLPYTCCP